MVHDGATQEDAVVNMGNALAAMAEHVAFGGDCASAAALLQLAPTCLSGDSECYSGSDALLFLSVQEALNRPAAAVLIESSCVFY